MRGKRHVTMQTHEEECYRPADNPHTKGQHLARTHTAPSSTTRTGPQAELSSAEVATMTAWLKEDLANGNITPEQAVKAFDALGASPETTRYDT